MCIKNIVKTMVDNSQRKQSYAGFHMMGSYDLNKRWQRGVTLGEGYFQ